MNDLSAVNSGATARTGSTLDFGSPGVEFGFEHALPAWAWALVVIAAALIAAASYRRLEGALWLRCLLAGVRTLLFIALAVIIAGPRLFRPNETIEKDWVLVLVDRSGSLGITDVAAGGSPAISRQTQLDEALALARTTFVQLGAERTLVWLGFDSGAYDLALDRATGLPTLGEPKGRRTDLASAIDGALRRAAARPIAGVVLVSDGRSAAPVPKSLLRRLEAEKVPVFTVALGSAEALADVGLRRIEAPRSAFVADIVPVEVELERTPAPADGGPEVSGTVELVDKLTGEVLDTQTATWTPGPDGGLARVTLKSRPTLAGQGEWQVRVKPGAGGDIVSTNNQQDVPIELVDRPLRVAYFDGYPRWEYRYLKNLLVRERSISSVVMLLAPGRKYLQEGTVVLDSLPRTDEEWENYDVIVMGDVVPGVFSPAQLESLKRRVTRGAGLVWIAGESSTPANWRATAMSDLLPMTFGPGAGSGDGGWADEARGAGGDDTSGPRLGPDRFAGPVMMLATPAADRAGILRLTESASESVPGAPWWPRSLTSAETGWSQLYWAQRLDRSRLKPTAEVLAVAIDTESSGSLDDSAESASLSRSAPPLVVSMRFGAGRAVYVATDEVWRWRYGRGETLTERFWLPIVRLLGRESLSRAGRPALIEATPERAEPLEPVRISVTLLDQSLAAEAAPESVQVRVLRAGGGLNDASAQLRLMPDAVNSEAGGRRSYSGTWLTPEPGRYVAEIVEPAIVSAASAAGRAGEAAGGLAASLRAGIDIELTDDELRQPQTDHELLKTISASSGGQSLSTGQLGQLPKLLPNRQLRLAGEPEIRTLWDSPITLAILIGLLALEWIGRRVLRLV
jgi:hypothetical protein